MSASCTIRYAETSTPGGSSTGDPSTVTSTGSPAELTCAASSSSRRRLGCGHERDLLTRLAQHAEEPAHLGKGLLTGVLDRIERRASLVRMLRRAFAGHRVPEAR